MTSRRNGFTLVELLVVIAIIGILISLLFPAVQVARESARRTQCANNLKQLALACVQHEHAQGFFPTGGWGYLWVGDPDRGFTARQPGGWHFNILPYMEEQELHDLGKNGDPNNNGKTQTAQTPVAAFICPTRRDIKGYPLLYPNWPFNNRNGTLLLGRSDYAANGGDNGAGISAGPGSLAAGDALSQDDWISTISPDVVAATGVSFIRSQVNAKAITDGLSKTYLIGERYMNPDNYETGNECDDDQGWDEGYDYDTYRWTNLGQSPLHDTPGNGWCDMEFGSAHSDTFQMAFCDGSVHAISYEIDPQTHKCLGNRSDGQFVAAPDD